MIAQKIDSYLRYAFLVLIFFLLYPKFSIVFLGLDLFGVFDEILLLSIGVFIFLKLLFTLKVDKRVFFLILAFLVLFILSFTLGKSVSVPKAIMQLLIHFKFYFFFYCFYLIFKDHRKILLSFIKFFLIVGFVGIVINMLGQVTFNRAFLCFVDYRSGILRTFGFFSHPNILGYFGAFMYIYFFSKKENLYSLKRFLLVSLFWTFVIFLSGSRSSLIIIPIALMYYLSSNYNFLSMRILIIVMIPVFLGLGVLLKDNEEFQRTEKNLMDISDGNDSGYQRAVIVFNSFILAEKYFPFGTGSATFGTLLSQNSPVYRELGLSKMRWVQEMKAIYDSNVASILGEFGVLGLLIFGVVLASLYNNEIDKATDHEHKVYFQAVLSLLIAFSLGNPVFMSSFHCLLFGMLTADKVIEYNNSKKICV